MRVQSVYFSAVKLLVILAVSTVSCFANQSDNLLKVQHEARVKSVAELMWFHGVLKTKKEKKKIAQFPEELEIALQKMD